MRRFCLALCFVLAFVGTSTFFEIKSAEAVIVGVSWESKSPFVLVDPQLRNTNVYSFGPHSGPNKPPMLGGNSAFIDIVDRTHSQLRLLESELGGPDNRRFVLRFDADSQWIYDQLFKKGFVTLKWSQIRGSFWDKKLKRFQAGAWRWAEPDLRIWEDCSLNCNYRACEEFGYHWSHLIGTCDCEEWQGKWFCHKKNFFTYSNKRDRN